MKALEVSHLSFAYAGQTKQTLQEIDFCLEKGDFCLLCGATGSGKSTLLRLLKEELSPLGRREGKIQINSSSSFAVGFVAQNPEEQIVTDKVWHELSFGLENMGLPRREIRRRVAEIVSYFGMEEWFDKDTSELSGGQKQILSLAAVCAMRPEILLLDEPTAQLDPVAAGRFLTTLERLHRDMGLTVLLSEHRLEEALPLADKVLALEEGSVLYFGGMRESLPVLSRLLPLGQGLPAAVRLWAQVGETGAIPLTVREGRVFLRDKFDNSISVFQEEEPKRSSRPKALECRDLFFDYGAKEVLSGLTLCVTEGEIYGLLGGNGAGKSTLMSIAAGLQRPCAGTVWVFGKKIETYRNQTLYSNCVAMLPQNIQNLFLETTVAKELKGADLSSFPFDLTPFLDRHPYDLSGGQQQLVALCKVLSCHSRLLLLDEPTRGLDAAAKQVLGDVLKDLRREGITLLLVSHDVEFVAAVADRCGMLFHGELTDEGTPHEFFAGNSYYSPAANRITRGYYEGVISVEEAARMCLWNGRKVP